MAAYTWNQLYDKVSSYLGFGRVASPPLSDSGQNSDVVDASNEGLRQAYYPATPQGSIYVWSFLQPRTTLSVAAADITKSVSGAVIGDVTWASNAGNTQKIKLIGEFALRNMVQNQNLANGFPKYCALLQSTAGTYQLQFERPFDGTYTLTYSYRVVPTIDSTNASSIYGGEWFSSLLMTSCLAAAELLSNNEIGVMSQSFERHLAAAITQDSQSRPSHAGTYYDKSYYQQPEYCAAFGSSPTFQYNGASDQ